MVGGCDDLRESSAVLCVETVAAMHQGVFDQLV